MRLFKIDFKITFQKRFSNIVKFYLKYEDLCLKIIK
jgi:hypothetical protein